MNGAGHPAPSARANRRRTCECTPEVVHHRDFSFAVVGMPGKVSLLTITSSYFVFVPLTHWPSTSGVRLTFLNGPGPPQRTPPTMVFMLVAATASRTSFAEVD